MKEGIIPDKISQLRQKEAIRKILDFFDGWIYPAVYAFLALLSSFFGLELIFYPITAAIIIFCCLFGKDTKPVLVPVVLVVYSTSRLHSPQGEKPSGFFSESYVIAEMSVLAVLILAAFIFRMIVFRGEDNFFRKKTAFTLGIILMSLAFLLNGALFTGYKISDLILGVAVALSFFGLYIFFYNTLEKRSDTVKYIAYLLLLASSVIFLQLLKALFIDGAFKDGSISKNDLLVGWGMSNNIGGMLVMFFPSCFYFAATCRKGILFYALAFVFFGGVCLTQSRASILVGGAVLAAAMVFFTFRKDVARRIFVIFNIIVVVAAAIIFIVFLDKIKEIFAVLFDRGFDDSERFFIWKSGWKNFLRAPIFGVGFYEPIAPDWSYGIPNGIFPDMYHNIFVQILASCGIFGLIAYGVHLYELGRLAFKKLNTERIFIFIVLACIIGTSLLDNHLFHIFPAMVYSVFLLLAERSCCCEKEGSLGEDRCCEAENTEERVNTEDGAKSAAAAEKQK